MPSMLLYSDVFFRYLEHNIFCVRKMGYFPGDCISSYYDCQVEYGGESFSHLLDMSLVQSFLCAYILYL